MVNLVIMFFLTNIRGKCFQMDRKLRLFFSVILLASLFSSCEDRTIIVPEFPVADDDAIVLDFSHRISTNYVGFVQFNIISSNIKSYQWSFGFLNQNGDLVTATTPSPGIFFPANGNYTVTLKGTDIYFNEYKVAKSIEIDSFP